MDKTTPIYVVTGGGGFVGRALCKALREKGFRVRSLSRGVYPELEDLGVETWRADIGTDPHAWSDALSGVQGVFHTAAKVDMWGPREGFFRTNVIGTRNLLSACQRHAVPAFVFTSSPSVIHDGSDLNGIDESYPYPPHYEAYYPETKAIAEREMLQSDGVQGVRTVSLRPHLIWGPGDTNLIPTVLERARKGRLTRIGNGKNLVDLTFIDDCVEAHLLAMQALETRPDVVGGKAYFISQGDPVLLWSWIDQVLAAHNLPRVTKSLSFPAAMAIANVLELGGRLLQRVGIECRPLLTRFLVTEMAKNHYFDISRARSDLGYTPSCTIEQAMARTFAR